MAPKAPVLLLVLVEAARLQWFVASIGLDGRTLPLLRSEEGDLAKYLGMSFDEQVDFLRHRLCGVVQRGCDRLWARDLRACQFVFLFEGPLADATGELTQSVADHFSVWMAKPPAVTFLCPAEREGEAAPPLRKLAGELPPTLERLLQTGLQKVLAAQVDNAAWEVSPRKT
jgi:hypothetical protein